MRIAIGPRTNAASWDWVGAGLAEGLSSFAEVQVFEDFCDVGVADIALAVKHPPPLALLQPSDLGRPRWVYMPIDHFRSLGEIEARSAVLAAVDLVLVHSEALIAPLAPHARDIGFIEHHARDVLPRIRGATSGDFALFIGALEHVPHLLAWTERRVSTYPLKILTNISNRRSRLAAHQVAHGLGLRLVLTDNAINGVPFEPWTPGRQQALMAACGAGIDIKGADFSQATKPPTKGQQFVASGIPFATNPGSATASYFRRRGLDLAEPDDTARLFSEGYRGEIARFAQGLRQHLSLATVSRRLVDRLAEAGLLERGSRSP